MDDYLTFLYRQYITAETYLMPGVGGSDTPVLRSRLKEYELCISEYLKHIKETAIEEHICQHGITE